MHVSAEGCALRARACALGHACGSRNLCTLVHFGAVVADAPSPLSTPRSAAGQAQLRLGKPLRMKCRASPVLLFMRAGRVVSGTVGIVRATVPFHGEHDAPEPTVREDQSGAVELRARQVPSEYRRNAREKDQQYGPAGSTLIQDRVASFGACRAVVFGTSQCSSGPMTRRSR